MKKIIVLFIIFISMFGLTACAGDNANTFHTSVEDKTEKIHNDIAAGSIRHVNISGNAKSIVIKQSADKYFEFNNKSNYTF